MKAIIGLSIQDGDLPPLTHVIEVVGWVGTLVAFAITWALSAIPMFGLSLTFFAFTVGYILLRAWVVTLIEVLLTILMWFVWGVCATCFLILVMLFIGGMV